MPLVVLNRNPEKLNDKLLKKLVDELPGLVAGVLTCEDPGGSLTAQDVEIWVQDFGPHDVNTRDVEIVIWANSFPKRLADLDFRRGLLCDFVRIRLPKETNGFVWILLQPGSYGEF